MDRIHDRAAGTSGDVAAIMDILVETRHKARASKSWEIADYIRDALKAAGYVIEDRADGTTWRKE